jgi:sulfonate transport system permease protein
MTSTTPLAATATGRRERGRSGSKRSISFGGLKGWVPLIALLGAWQVLGDPASVAFPRPSTWYRGVVRLYESGALIPGLQTTLYTFATSLLIATVLGTCLGYVLGSSARVDRALSPLMDFFRTLPPPAIVPVTVLLLGPTVRASVTIVVVAIIWPILLNVAASTRGIPPVRLETARTLGLSARDRLMRVVLPSLMPGLLLGLRIAVSISLIVTLLVDIIGHGAGLGRLLVERQQRFDTEAVWGLLAIIGVLGYCLNCALAWVGRRLPGTA